jgi:glycosidase
MPAINPVLYQINTRVWVKRFGPAATLADVPPDYWTRLASLGVDYVWLMGVWQTGPNILDYALEPGLRDEYSRVLPDWTEADVIGSPYAIDSYTLNAQLGPPETLAEVRRLVNAAGMRLILDFVPNHFHAESRWLATRPEVFLAGDEQLLQEDGHTFYRSEQAGGRIVAHGKDPYFAAWQDTVQLNYAVPETHTFMAAQLEAIAAQCDGVRCDMAMLLLPEVFRRTWQGALPKDAGPLADFWSSTITRLKATYPDFQLLAEVYWNLEWELQERGFDYTYDKRLLDRLHRGDVAAIRAHLGATPRFQQRSVRFLENHDEDRALATMSPSQVQAAALIAYTIPGLRFFYEGQWEGRCQRLPVQLGRLPAEHDALDQYGRGLRAIDLAALPGFDPVSQREPAFYDWLLALLREAVLRRGEWALLETHYPALLVWQWSYQQERLTILVNYSQTSFTANLTETFSELAQRDVWGQTLDMSRLWFGAFGWRVLRR